MADLNLSSKANTTFGHQSFISRVSSFRHSPRINLVVQLLDESDQLTVTVKSSATGQAVLDDICDQLNIVEREFFGLRYQDNNKFRFWLDLNKPINKQVKGDFIFISLRFRFYPKNPFLLKEDITRYQLFVQLRRDLLHGRLHCTQTDAIRLAGLILQAVLGDYDEIYHATGYVSEYKLILKQTERLEQKIAEYHRELKGMTSLEAETQFLKYATEIETYGFDPYVVKDGKQAQDLVIGATCRGIMVFSKSQLLKSIPWKNLAKLDYTGKELRVYPNKDFVEADHFPMGVNNTLDMTLDSIHSNGNLNNSKSSSSFTSKKLQYKLICPNSTYAKHLWRHLLSQQVFFTEDEAKLVKPKFSKPKIPLLFRGSTFRCPTRKVLHELEANPLPPREDQPINYTRYPLPKQIARSEVISASSRTGTLKSARSSKATSPPVIEETLAPSSESESLPFDSKFKLPHTASEDTLTNIPPPPAASTPISNRSPDFSFNPPQFSNSTTDSAYHTQISTTSIQTTSDEDLSSHKILREDFYEAPTTIMEEDKPIEKILQEDYEEEFPPLPTPPSLQQQSNGTTSNGKANGHVAKKRNRKNQHEEPVVKKLLRSVLSMILLLMLCSIVAIVVFEANEGKGIKWTRDIHPISSFRQIVYDPSKDAIRQLLKRFHK